MARHPLGARLGALAGELAAALGDAAVLVDPDATERFRRDWTGAIGGYRALVVRPSSSAEVATALSAAAARGVPVVAQGGNTGLVGGSVPGAHDTVVLSTERLRTIGALDEATGQVTVGAGVTLTELAERLAGTGWRHAVDMGSRDAATIGGTVATNAGGMRVFRLGDTRRHVAGLEYVTAAGEVVTRLAGITKDNTGYDLEGLLCGSEGTLGVICSVRLRLVPDAPARATAMLGFGTRRAAMGAAWELRRTCAPLEVAELVSGACLDLVADVAGIARPVAGDAALLVDAASSDDPTDALAGAIAALGPAIAPVDVAVAGTDAQRAALWRVRDDLTVAIATLGRVQKFDVSVPAATLDRFCDEVGGLIGRAGGVAWLFGHVCDDNVHVNATGVDPDAAEPLLGDVLRLVAEHGGSISAEHGIGRWKAPWLHLSRSRAEIAAMRAIKDALDPDGLLNPGVLFATPTGRV